MSKIAALTGNKLVLALGAGVVATGAVAASAATLGTLTPQSLGTSTAAVSGCQNGSLVVNWGAPTYASPNSYTITGATLGGINATCNNKPFKMTIADAAGDSLVEVTGTALTGTVATTFAATDTAEIGNVTVTIYG